jgi:hypothetical protein
MDFNEILKLLGVDKLDESQQEDIKTKIADIVDVQVAEKVSEKLEEAKTELVEEYEGKFEDYKKTIVTNFSNFVDQVLEEELLIPENIMEYARLGELYSDLINEFKVRIGIDEGVLDEEAKVLLKEARDEIVRLQDQLNEATARELEATGDAQALALESYKMDKCLSVPTAERGKIMSLLEGTTTKTEVDRKFKFLVENRLFEGAENVVEDEVTGEGHETVIDENKEGKSDEEIIEEAVDDKSPFNEYMDRWVQNLKNTA